MKIFNKHLAIMAAVVLFLITSDTDLLADSVAFGYFINKSENRSMDYLQMLLPNSFASSLKNKHNIDTVKPGKLIFLNTAESEFTGKEIEEKDLKKISYYFADDYFVYGNYQPLPGNRIKINVKIYKKYTNRVFSFTEEGKLETELFRFIDRVSYQIKNITSDSMYYKSDSITQKSKISIITNVSGEDLNLLYFSFLKNGYRLSSVQGNELYSHLDENQIKKLSTVSAANAYYHIISDKSEIELFHGTWSGASYYKNLLKQRDVFNKYAFNFEKTFESLSKKIQNFQPDSFDYFIVIGFDEDQENAWIRCISIKNNKLILTESEIKGKGVGEISEKIINTLTSDPPKKF